MWNGYETINRIFASSKEKFIYIGGTVYNLGLSEKQKKTSKPCLHLSFVIQKISWLQKLCLSKLHLSLFKPLRPKELESVF